MVKWSATEWWAIEIWFDLWSVAVSGWVGLGNEMILYVCPVRDSSLVGWFVRKWPRFQRTGDRCIGLHDSRSWLIWRICKKTYLFCQVLSHFLLTPCEIWQKGFLHSFEDFCEDFLKCFVFCEPPRAMASMLPPALFLGCNRRSENHWNVSTSLQMASQVPNFVMMHFLLSKFSASWGSMPFLCTKVCSIRKLFVQSLLSKES